MLVASPSPATMTVVRSSLEVMLDSLRKKDESGQDSIPALPVRPVSIARRPSSTRLPRPAVVKFNGSKDGRFNEKKVEVVPPLDPKAAAGAQIDDRNVSDESHDQKQEACSQPPIDCIIVPSTDANNEQSQEVRDAIVEDLQMRVFKAEAALKVKEEENDTLKLQIQQFETKWLEYEAKMKSMGDKWEQKMTSLQTSLDAATKSLAAAHYRASQAERHDKSKFNLAHFDSEVPIIAQPRGASALVLLKNPDNSRGTVSHMVKEFEQQTQGFENDAKLLIQVKSGQSHANMKQDEELQRLKARFATWKKDYKIKLYETKVELRKLCNSEGVKTPRKWWNLWSAK